jgi:serine/threonine-protein kinase RsbW
MATIEKKFTIQVPSSTENLALIREFIAGVGARAGLGQSDIDKLELAADEACANVIEHAYESDMTREVIVRAAYDEELLQITIEDNGRGFDPQAVPQADVESLASERRSGGLGLKLIRTLMDEVQYERLPGRKNELRMIKRIRKQ